jgi:hypothetical protein
MNPSGLHMPDASLARNLVGATPTEQVMPYASWTWARMSAATAPEVAFIRRSAPLTSMNASSRLSGSTSGEMSRKIAITPRDVSW